jgi:hypothetical protein
MQSVSQYDTFFPVQSSDHAAEESISDLTPANRRELSESLTFAWTGRKPAARVRDDDLFTMHYVHMAAELARFAKRMAGGGDGNNSL